MRPPTPIAFDLDTHVGGFSLRVAHAGHAHRLAIVGASGSGKSITLRALAGLLGPAGDVSVDRAPVGGLPPDRRRIGYVPQGFGLLPGATVWQQATFGVGTDLARAAWWLGTLGLDGLDDRLPSELSGGQRQRVSLARALAAEPDIVLLDEPFSALDAPVRDELRRELRRLQRDAGLSTVLVTHDPEEAALLADELVVVDAGRVLQSGSVAEVYRRPASTRVARLLGLANLGQGQVGEGRQLQIGSLLLPVDTGLAPGTTVGWSVPSHGVHVGAPGSVGAAPGSGGLVGVIRDVIDLGTATELTVGLANGSELRARQSGGGGWVTGQPCEVVLDPDLITVWRS